MGKGNGSTRASSSRAANGIQGGQGSPNIRGINEVSYDDLADRLFSIKALAVDPGDAVYETAANLARTDGGRSIEESIEGSTDYFAQATRNFVQVGNNGLNTGEAMERWGADDMVRIPYENRSLMDIIWELRTSNVGDIYRKYR